MRLVPYTKYGKSCPKAQGFSRRLRHVAVLFTDLCRSSRAFRNPHAAVSPISVAEDLGT